MAYKFYTCFRLLNTKTKDSFLIGMTHWLSEPVVRTVKLESQSPSLEIASSNISALMASSLTNSPHLDTTSLFCTNQSSTSFESFQSTPTLDHKQEYYNTYYNGMQQYTSSFYPSYATTGYSNRSSKISSTNNYLTSNYANVAPAVTNNSTTQLYSTYGYNNFNQFTGSQQDYPTYYNDQYGYYNTSSYPSYNSSNPSGGQNFHISSTLNDNSSDIHPSTPAIAQHSPNSTTSITSNVPTMVSNKALPITKRARGRRHANSSPTRSITSENGQNTENLKGPDRVFIWDLDETIIIFHSMITGTFASRHSKDPMRMNYLATSMEELIFNMADHHFFFNDIESCDQVHIDDVSSDDNGQELANYDFRTDGFLGNTANAVQSNLCLPNTVRGGVDWMRKLAFRYRKIKDIYNMYKNK